MYLLELEARVSWIVQKKAVCLPRMLLYFCGQCGQRVAKASRRP
jgi:hypothetical protein